ncbi:serine/threonine-protein kinase VRK3 isoform 2-T6 [Pholidichthys leucotaenia]
MPFHFCPQCGTKLQPGFKFCPSCGEKLPQSESPDDSGPVPTKTEATASALNTKLVSSVSSEPIQSSASVIPVISRPPIRKTRNSLRLDKEVKFNIKDAASPTVPSTNPAAIDKFEDNGVVGQVSPQKQPQVNLSPSAPGKSPRAGKSKAKKAKYAPCVDLLPEGEEVTDTTGKKWKLMNQISQSTTELIYEVLRLNSKETHHIHHIKLGTKDGRIFNEQNFLQRAAKPVSVEKWIKQNKLDFLGVPSCVGFGLHSDLYRFLIFPNMGQSLQSIIKKEKKPLSEKVVLQLACRILDVLLYIHSNEYVHADISAENIYIKPGEKSQVYLTGYCHAFRYSPGGKHVEYREASRTPHEGAVEFISLDAHKGAGPSRRSDLQSLGYCMLHWHTGSLPWTELTQPDQVASQKKRFMEDITGLLHHCFGKKKVSSAFQTYLTAVMALQYSEQPNYLALKSELGAALLQLGGSMEELLSF